MPSAHEKARAAKKKEAAKKKGGKKATDDAEDESAEGSKGGTPAPDTPSGSKKNGGTLVDTLTSEEKLVLALEDEARYYVGCVTPCNTLRQVRHGGEVLHRGARHPPARQGHQDRQLLRHLLRRRAAAGH
jgi:hypothetical protein